MKISYKDIQRGSDYQGTRITIQAENSVEWGRIQGNFIAKCLPHKGTWFYKPETNSRKKTITACGYDGFLASLIERELTGDRINWTGTTDEEINRKFKENLKKEKRCLSCGKKYWICGNCGEEFAKQYTESATD